jgi:hypothetical protein
MRGLRIKPILDFEQETGMRNHIAEFPPLTAFCISALLLLLTSCGGGGAGQGTPAVTSGTYITATVTSSPGASVTYYAMVDVRHATFQGAPIADAVVTINGTTLTYNSVISQYTGNVIPDASTKYNLSITANGTTFTSIQDAPTSLPVMNVPNPLTAASANTISWTPNISVTGLTPSSYGVRVYTSTNHVFVYESIVTGTSVTVPANTLTATVNYCVSVAANYPIQPITNANAGSQFIVWAVPTSICRGAQ